MRGNQRLKRTSMFIDGFNLYHGMKAISGRAYLWLDLESLALSLIKPQQQVLISVLYFTAMIRDDPEALKRQDTYLSALEAFCPRVEVVRGTFQRRKIRCDSCQNRRVSYEEKETDVSLAVRLVEGAANRDFDTAVLLSGDSDFVPAVAAAKRLHPSLRVVAVFPPKRVSDALRRVADANFVLGRARISQNQLPFSVHSPRGPLLRPDHWN